MEAFTHIQASSVDEASALLKQYGGKACLIAGGTDLMGCLKDRLWFEYPEAVIDLKGISGLRDIERTDEGLIIGALATLTEVSESPLVKKLCPCLAEAARRTASPLLRNMGTLGGNICQENRCWYYRYPDKLGGMIPCVRKGGQKCLAVVGDNRYHSIFGLVNKCIAVNPSDTAPALVALDAAVITSTRTIPAQEFFSAEHGKQSTVLEQDEVVVAIRVPQSSFSFADGAKGTEQVRSAFKKVAFRKSIDFALVNCAARIGFADGKVVSARICLNGVYNIPKRATEAEEHLIGKALDEELAAEAAGLALAGAKPLLANQFKVLMAQATLADCVMLCA